MFHITAENIATTLEESIKEWSIPTKIDLPIVSDNAANMVKAVGLMKATIHVGCLANTINLAAQKSLAIKQVSHVLAKVRRTVAFFHRSPQATAIFRTKAELLGISNHKLKMDVQTRWNSAHDMIERFLEMQCAVVATKRCKEMSKSRDKGDFNLTDDDITLLEDVRLSEAPQEYHNNVMQRESSNSVHHQASAQSNAVQNCDSKR